MAGYFETLLFTDAQDANSNSHSSKNNNNNNNNNNTSNQGDSINQHNIGLLTSQHNSDDDRVMLSIRPSTHTTNMYR